MASHDPIEVPGTQIPENASTPAPTTPGSLSFDKATFAGPSTSQQCAACKQPLVSEYYAVGGRTICTSCRNQIAGPRGDRWAFWRALAYGGGAAATGTLIWSLIIHFTGYELGLIAIGIGVGIGVAVRKGSRGFGGRKYQALAMLLTYVSITTSYVPIIVKGVVKSAKERSAAVESGKTATETPPAVEAQLAKGEATQESSATSKPDPSHLPLPLALLAFFALVWGLALAAPFLAGTSNIMGLIIIGIGLYEAWKLNRAPKLAGPFRLNQPGAAIAQVP
jgi:hypothetical protein